MNILETIAKAHYAANTQQVEQLAFIASQADDAGTFYLRIVLARMQSKLGRPRRGKQPPQEPVLDAIHAELYPHVLKGVGAEDMAQPERNNKAIFARTMASTVRYFIRGGGDVRSLDVATATKTGMRKAVTPDAPQVPAGTRAQKSFEKAHAALLRALPRLLKGDPDDARGRVDALMDELEAWLEQLDGPPPQVENHSATTTLVGARARATPREPVQLHRGA